MEALCLFEQRCVTKGIRKDIQATLKKFDWVVDYGFWIEQGQLVINVNSDITIGESQNWLWKELVFQTLDKDFVSLVQQSPLFANISKR